MTVHVYSGKLQYRHLAQPNQLKGLVIEIQLHSFITTSFIYIIHTVAGKGIPKQLFVIANLQLWGKTTGFSSTWCSPAGIIRNFGGLLTTTNPVRMHLHAHTLSCNHYAVFGPIHRPFYLFIWKYKQICIYCSGLWILCLVPQTSWGYLMRSSLAFESLLWRALSLQWQHLWEDGKL